MGDAALLGTIQDAKAIGTPSTAPPKTGALLD
jgi:hypothetical protein